VWTRSRVLCGAFPPRKFERLSNPNRGNHFEPNTMTLNQIRGMARYEGPMPKLSDKEFVILTPEVSGREYLCHHFMHHLRHALNGLRCVGVQLEGCLSLLSLVRFVNLPSKSGILSRKMRWLLLLTRARLRSKRGVVLQALSPTFLPGPPPYPHRQSSPLHTIFSRTWLTIIIAAVWARPSTSFSRFTSWSSDDIPSHIPYCIREGAGVWPC
jgi:hypothetical protein